MTDLERAFLADIAANPSDDVPRLIYADFLEEHSQPERAEFIRVQCERARPGLCRKAHSIDEKCAYCLRWHDLPRRERELLTTEGPPILGTKSRCRNGQWETLAYRWAPVPILHCDWWEFRRGFISTITLPCSAFLEHAADIIEAVPMLEEVRLSDVGPMELHFNDGPAVWVFSRASAWPAAFDDAVNLTHDNRENALSIMSRCALQFAHDQLAARRNFRPGIVAATAH